MAKTNGPDRSDDQRFGLNRFACLRRERLFEMIMKNRLLSVWVGARMIVAVWCSAVRGGTIYIYPSQDNSIYSEGNNSNALGGLYAGVTPKQAVRRALLQFDIAGSGIPAGSIINSVSLGLTQTRISLLVSATFELHPLSAAWGEGTSSGIGQGDIPTPSDATWNHRLYNTNLWTSPGGDFGSTSGTTTIGSINTLYTFSSQAGMVADVQNWLNTPSSNFGWILRAADESIVTAREFGSRENSLVAQQPSLTVDFTPVPEPGTWVLLGAAAVVASVYRLRSRRFEAIVSK